MANPAALTRKWAPGMLNNYGEPYQDYSFYSLYGWRVTPPPWYPQDTFNTPFDIKMEGCDLRCSDSSHDSGACLERCHLQAVKYAVKESRRRKSSSSKPTRENFSNVTRSVPAHTSPRYRSYSGGQEMAPFCFYR